MTFLVQLCRWLADSWVGTQIRESDNLFSAIETVHVLGVTASAGLIMIVDLAVLRVIFTRHPIQAVLKPLVRVSWLGFGLMTVSGGLLFWSEADKLYVNWAFRVKMLLLVALGLNQWVFHRRFAASSANHGRAAAVLSLCLWTGVVVLGRAIAYV